ncbi:MAG TPA: NAD-dependent succinate-semialdehyde dehydrogenase [Polyangia bacterium]|nr:NAD-dependent succinate-semialdehyde dehydrogenase [Polyangia bacterium]
MPIASLNPATGQLLRSFDEDGPEIVERKLAAAASGWERWRRKPVATRAAIVARAGEILETEREAFGRLMTLEMGKLAAAAAGEASKCATACRFYAEHAAAFLSPEIVGEGPDSRDEIQLQPLGPVLAVMPWNFPFWQVIRFAAPALVAGNVGLLKHASNVPQCALALEDLFRRAGAPEGVFQTLLVGSAAVEKLIGDPRIAAVTVTGSEPAGRAIAAAAGRHLKKSVLELGGSDPFLVLASADLDQAVATAVKARTINTGQSCIAAKRFIVVSGVYDRFAAAFTEAMRGLVVGDPGDARTQIGPLATASIRDGVADQVERSVAAGARLLTGGRVIDRAGFYYEPTVLADLPPDAPAAREEVFGPVAALFRVRDTAEAIAVANDTAFGLGAAAFTRDRAEAERLARELEAGSVFINGMVASDPRFPFGGIKSSGYGRELSSHGLREFMNVKTVRMANLPG